MIALSCGLALGAVCGVAATWLIGTMRRREISPLDEVTGEDCDTIEVNFAAHINHLRDEVSDFADRLAGDDVLLRERLRAFETGDRS